MEELRFALLIFGGCAIFAILAHGLWSLRKNNKSVEKPRVEPVSYDAEPQGFDEFGLGEVRVINKQSDPSISTDTDLEDNRSDVDDNADHMGAAEATVSEEYPGTAQIGEPSTSQVESEPKGERKGELDVDTYPVMNDEVETTLAPEPEPEPEPEPTKLYGSVVSNPKPTFAAKKTASAASPAAVPSNDMIPEPPSFLLQSEQQEPAPSAPVIQPDQALSDSEEKNDDVASFSLDQAPSDAAAKDSGASSAEDSVSAPAKRMMGRKRSRPIQRKRVEPSLGEDQMRIDFDTSQGSEQILEEDAPLSAQEPPEPTTPPQQEVLVLNVRAPNEQEINGAALLPMLLTLGFKFGDQDIFHRHVNSNGKGPVLFSLANMFKPGVFDIDNLENFTTQGVSLFMILPIEGDPHQVFNMMHNAARKLAEEFSCQILDGRRSVLTKQGLQQYVEKIREFERQRMIARN